MRFLKIDEWGLKYSGIDYAASAQHDYILPYTSRVGRVLAPIGK